MAADGGTVAPAVTHADEVKQGDRFRFGENWSRFLEVLNDDRIERAAESLRSMLGVSTLEGKRLLDAGSGSGLFSLAAYRLGARVHSFDYDPRSVACTRELRRRFVRDDAAWTVDEASVLDSAYLATLGQFDVVYSWGVLHHTGDMWQAMARVAPLVAPDGQLFIAIYNDQGIVSDYWLWVKRLYNKSRLMRGPLLAIHALYPFLPSLLVRTFSGRVADRGMSFWHDVIDWIGGLPFEVATPAAVTSFYAARGFVAERTVATTRLGCNQYVFRKLPAP